MTVLESNRPHLYVLKCRCWDNRTQQAFEVYARHDNWSIASLSRVLWDNGYLRCVVLSAFAVPSSELECVEVAA